MYKFWEISLTDQIQAFCAIMTLLLAIMIAWQNKKIKSLTDVVTSLNRQAEISQELLSFEIRSRMTNIQPIFRTGSFRVEDPILYRFNFSLVNIGTRARNLSFKVGENIEYVRKNNTDNAQIKTNEQQMGNFKTFDFMDQYKFDVFFEDDFGVTYLQKVTGMQGRLKISLPVEIKEQP